MRLRKVQNAYENLLKDTKYFIPNPKDFKGKWNKEVFNNQNPVMIEVGCGKGDFALGMAMEFPFINFIAVEKFDSVLIRASEKLRDYDIPNLKIILLDALMLDEVFEKGEVRRVYLNFSDPWPKARQAKRRLTSSIFLNIYQNILDSKCGDIVQKTDNRGLFESSLESFANEKYYLSKISLDLHSDDRFNVETEYERRFSKTSPIYYLEARKNVVEPVKFYGYEKEFKLRAYKIMEELNKEYPDSKIYHIGSTSRKTITSSIYDFYIENKNLKEDKIQKDDYVLYINYPSEFLEFDEMLSNKENLSKLEEYKQKLKDMFEYQSDIYYLGLKYYMNNYKK